MESAVWTDGFLFVGNQLALDFVNTRPLQDGEYQELLLDFSALLRWFQAAGLLGMCQAARIQREFGRSARAARLVKSMREFRERLRGAILSWEGGGPVPAAMIAELNALMSARPRRMRLEKSKAGISLHSYFDPHKLEDLLAPLAQSAAMLFAEIDRRRVRKCEHCVLHYYDASKKSNRRWCSMRLCGNRYKVAAYAVRQRSQSE